MIIISVIMTLLVASLFWQPQFSDDYKPRKPYKPTKKERYIKNINKLLDQGHYSIVVDLLANSKYPREELPWDYWAERIASERERISEEAEKLEDIKDLEKILGS